jgi:hypothetical protein
MRQGEEPTLRLGSVGCRKCSREIASTTVKSAAVDFSNGVMCLVQTYRSARRQLGPKWLDRSHYRQLCHLG